MAVDLGAEQLVKQERSSHVIRLAPARTTPLEALQAIQIVIQRELVFRDGEAKILAQGVDAAYTFSYAELDASPAIAAYVAACGASSLAEMMQREVVLYEALVAERKAALAQ